jgi:folate-dependent phosphoribosylglycinamide formyltransferase PurN
MKIAVLTSDIIDGKIVTQKLLDAQRDVRAIIYEKKRKGIKARLKLILYFLLGRIRFISYERVVSFKKDILVRGTDDINRQDNINLLKEIGPDIIVVVGTRKLKKDVFSQARLAAINLHSGILPFYRGADSEFWALCNNEPHMVGATVHFISEELDAGDIILQERLPVKPSDIYRSLRMKNICMASGMINKAISLIESGHCPRIRQDPLLARSYLSAKNEEINKFEARQRSWQRRSTAIKSFGVESMPVEEEVARMSSIEFMHGCLVDYPSTFSLRIDADEFDKNTFESYLGLFKEYKAATTIFVNANSFSNAKDEIIKCRELGVDIQSHGFYHHIYNDYQSNFYNICKAREFFKGLDIDTKGFVAPMGRWNKGLMLALENAGYKYSSDFSYDYLGLPSYPDLGSRFSSILEIPVFPVACELFFQKGLYELKAVVDYFKNAIDEMDACAIPVMIYAHTSSFKDTPVLLKELAEYAINKKGLRPIQMTRFYEEWKSREILRLSGARRVIKLPRVEFLGKSAGIKTGRRLKDAVKRYFDFERITPLEELRCSLPKRAAKRFLRKLL